MKHFLVECAAWCQPWYFGVQRMRNDEESRSLVLAKELLHFVA